METEKLLPQNLEAEAGVLGGCLISPDMVPVAVRIVEPDDFYREAHREVWRAIVDLYNAGQPADLITLSDELARRGKLEEMGGISYISSLANQVPTSYNTAHYADIVFRTATLRRLITAAGQIAAVAYADADAKMAYTASLKAITRVGARLFNRDDQTYAEVTDELHEDLLLRIAGDPGALAFALGVPSVDFAMGGGLERGELSYVIGAPSMGKTGIGSLFAHSAAEQCREIVERARAAGDQDTQACAIYVSLEMQPKQLARRAVAWRSEVNTRLMRNGFRQADGAPDLEKYQTVADAIAVERERKGAYLRMKGGPMRFTELRAYAMAMVELFGARILVLDQLDLLRDDSHEITGEPRSRDEYTRVTNLSRALKQLAGLHELNIPIVVLCQVKREARKRDDPTPTMEDAKGSGQIEQDADYIWGIHRPAFYDGDEGSPLEYTQLAELHLLKARDSARGRVVYFRYEEAFGGRITPWPARFGDPEAIRQAERERQADEAREKKAAR